MNQHQRKFLLEQIEQQYKSERSKLLQDKPKAPSLNNYLTAAILDGTAVMRPQKDVQTEIRNRVRDLGKTEALISDSRSGWGRGGDSDREDCISIPALLMFEAPKDFAVVQKHYEEAMKRWEEQMQALESSINAMRIKVQVGSDKALEVLVDQADKLCSMSLTAFSKLLLPEKTSS